MALCTPRKPPKNKAQIFTQLDCHNFTVCALRNNLCDRFIFRTFLNLLESTYACSFRNNCAVEFVASFKKCMLSSATWLIERNYFLLSLKLFTQHSSKVSSNKVVSNCNSRCLIRSGKQARNNTKSAQKFLSRKYLQDKECLPSSNLCMFSVFPSTHVRQGNSGRGWNMTVQRKFR